MDDVSFRFENFRKHFEVVELFTKLTRTSFRKVRKVLWNLKQVLQIFLFRLKCQPLVCLLWTADIINVICFILKYC